MPATLADIQVKYGDGVYPLYKEQMHEPYMEEDHGIGYKGVVMYNELEDKIQCQECGGWYQTLARHLKTHNLGATEYKDRYGLNYKIPLCTLKLSKARSITGKRVIKDYPDNNIKAHRLRWTEKGMLSSSNPRKSHNKVSFKNEYGLCDAQVASRLLIVRDMCFKSDVSELTNEDITKHDKRLKDFLYRKYGSIKSACESLGLKHIGQTNYEDSEIIAKLRTYVRDRRSIPKVRKGTISDLGISLTAVYNHFGSWRRAKMMAGLDQLLQEIQSDPHKGIPAHLIVGGRPNE